jgi:hypothetical protein
MTSELREAVLIYFSNGLSDHKSPHYKTVKNKQNTIIYKSKGWDGGKQNGAVLSELGSFDMLSRAIAHRRATRGVSFRRAGAMPPNPRHRQ